MTDYSELVARLKARAQQGATPGGGVVLLLIVALFLLMCVLFGGCASWSRETRIEELAYQTLGAIDVAQSVQASRHPDCYQESELLTSFVIGNHPSPGKQIAWGISRGALHAFVTNWLEENDSDIWTKRVWQGLSIGMEVKDVNDNRVIGLSISSARPPAYAPCLRGLR